MNSAGGESRMQSWANNYSLQVFGRVSMVAFTAILAPIIIIVTLGVSSILHDLRDGIYDLKLQIQGAKLEMINLKTLQEYQLKSFDDRLSAQSRRMDSQDTRVERLERRVFIPGMPGPTSP